MATRRKFLKYIFWGSAGAAVTYTSVHFFTGYEKTIADILFEDLKGLKVKKEDIHAFSKLAAKENPWKLNYPRQRFLSFYDSKLLRKIHGPFHKEYHTWRDAVVATFLLSTDFFTNKMDEHKPITYTGKIYGPYTMPCRNPFTSLYYTLT